MIQENYTKRHYRDVVGTFDFTAKSPDIALLGMLPLSNKVSVGINDTGIWLWHIDPADKLSLRIFPENCPIGFFEWRWIREIQVSYSRRMAFFLFNDLDAMLQQVVLAESRETFAKTFVIPFAHEQALRFPLTGHKHFSAMDYVASHHYTQVYIIE